MEVNLIVLGSLFILVLFTVGESVYKLLGLKRWFVLLMLTVFIATLFLPDINLFGQKFSTSGFIFLCLLNLILLFKTKSFLRLVVSFLISMLGVIVYKSFYDESILEGFLQLYMPLSMLLGVLVALIAGNAPSAFVALFWGFNFGDVLFNLNRFESLPSVIGEQTLLSALLFGYLAIIVTRFFILKIKSLSESAYQVQNK